MDTLLNDVEVRVLGCLIEKQLTTPEYYPLTLNALTNACNQKNNRDPVVDYDDKRVISSVDSLRAKGLACKILSSEFRVPKYEHDIKRKLGLSDPEMAVMCELLLRGPQTPGELRGKCQRLYGIPTVEDVTRVLGGLMERPGGPLVMVLPQGHRQKEVRYAQLLAGEPDLSLYTREEPFRTEARAADRRGAASLTASLEERLQRLEETVAALSKRLDDFVAQFE
jgi:uncharacterized protein YceH (UPF0502 family)